jgi:hypothetical protein
MMPGSRDHTKPGHVHAMSMSLTSQSTWFHASATTIERTGNDKTIAPQHQPLGRQIKAWSVCSGSRPMARMASRSLAKSPIFKRPSLASIVANFIGLGPLDYAHQLRRKKPDRRRGHGETYLPNHPAHC